VIIRYLDAPRTCFGPDEAHPVLVIDTNAVLAFAITFQRLQPISRRHPKRSQSYYGVKLVQLSPRDRPELLRTRSSHGLAVSSVEYVLGTLIVKALNHLIFPHFVLVETAPITIDIISNIVIVSKQDVAINLFPVSQRRRTNMCIFRCPIVLKAPAPAVDR